MTAALRKAAIAAGVTGWAIVPILTAVAQHSGSLEIDVADCVALTSPAERFACYESRASAALEGESSETRTLNEHDDHHDLEEAISPEPSEPDTLSRPNQAVPLEVIRDSGSGGQIEVSATAGEQSEFGQRPAREEPSELFATIAGLRETVPNRYLITLENGQVWRQMRPQWYPLQVGHRVRIYSTRWGPAYRLAAEELNGFIQVERVR